MSHLPIRDNSVVSSLTISSGKFACGWKSGKKKSAIDKIKKLLNYYGNPSQQILTIKTVLEDLRFNAEINYTDVINMEK